ncbi:MAG: antibiotic biosynthesis monooxygenase [Gammaproteobacteria bacterium]
MESIANTPEPPYYVTIFTSLRTPGDQGYDAMANRMAELSAQQPGFLGMESAREGVGLTLCYWKDLPSIANWRRNVEHTEARRLGREKWYTEFRVRIARVERDYGEVS